MGIKKFSLPALQPGGLLFVAHRPPEALLNITKQHSTKIIQLALLPLYACFSLKKWPDQAEEDLP
jgi:hypothetical protein